MRDVMELLRAKEQELLKVKRQVEALRIAAPLLGDEGDGRRLLPRRWWLKDREAWNNFSTVLLSRCCARLEGLFNISRKDLNASSLTASR